jgi:hypothetical protein
MCCCRVVIVRVVLQAYAHGGRAQLHHATLQLLERVLELLLVALALHQAHCGGAGVEEAELGHRLGPR